MISILLSHLEAVFGWLLAASWQASVLALLVLGLQQALRGRLNPRWRYALWLLVLLRLVLPVLPESTLSLFQFAPTPPVQLVTPVTEPWQPLFTGKPYPSPQDAAPMVTPNYPFSYFTLLTLLWLAGAGILLVLTWQVNRRFARQVANSPAISDPELLELFAEAKTELGIRRPIRLIENEQLQSPAIMGLFLPTLLLPADVREKFDSRELRFIFLHELAHLKRGDVIAQGVIALLQILHWFNPVLWFAFRRMRLDREPATDALVLSRTGEEEKERYGLMLIKLLEHFNQRHSLPTLVGILEDKDQFKRRFSLIARFTRGAYGWSLLGIFLIGVLAIVCLTKAKDGGAAAAENPEFFANYPFVPIAPGEPFIQITLQDKTGGSICLAAARPFARTGGSSENRQEGVLATTTDSDYVVDKDVKFIKARYVIHSAKGHPTRIAVDLPITSSDAVKSIPIGAGFSATAVLLEPTKLLPPAPVPAKKDQASPLAYRYDLKVFTIPASLRDRFKALQKSGNPMDIVKEQGVKANSQSGGGLFPDQQPTWVQIEETNFLVQASSVTPDVIYLKGSFESVKYDTFFHLGDHFQVFAVGDVEKAATGDPAAGFFHMLVVRAVYAKPGVPMRPLPEY